MGLKHPIRDLLVLWFGERMFKRHERKKAQRAATRPYDKRNAWR